MFIFFSRKIAVNFFFIFVFLISTSFTFADTVSGGGYFVNQVITPVGGALSGNGYLLNIAGQYYGGNETGGGYTLSSPFGLSSTSSTSTPPSPPPSGGGGGGYFVFPNQNTTSTIIINTSTSTKIIETKGSTCSFRVTFSLPIDIGLSTNVKEDVEKLETFLNDYEGEKLKVNGIYEKADLEAVKRFQEKYRSFILDPMRLKNPTGTVYNLTQRHIERITSKKCGEVIVINSCPFFKKYTSYGDKGTEVKKIQLFLNIVRGETLPVSGVYGPLTKEAAKRFQRAYKKDIFNPLKLSFISGNWNASTREKANKTIGCDIIN